MQKGTVVQMEEGPGSSWGMDTDLWYIYLDSFAGTKAPTLLDNGNFRLSTKSWSTALWSHYQPRVTHPAACLPNFVNKILSETPLPPRSPCIIVQSLSRVWLFATPRTAACRPSLSITNSQRLLKLMSIKLVMPSSHLILCGLLLLLPSTFPSIRVFSNESALSIRWPKYWSFSFIISPSNEHPGLISFRMDWLDLLAVQGTLKSLLQHHSSKASVLRHSAFFMVQLSHPYMTTGCMALP